MRTANKLATGLLSQPRELSRARFSGWTVLADYSSSLITSKPNEPVLYHQLRPARLLSGDRDGYRRVRDAALKRFADWKQRGVGPIILIWVLAPDPSDDPSVPLRMAEDSAQHSPRNPWPLFVLGGAHFPPATTARRSTSCGVSSTSIRHGPPEP